MIGITILTKVCGSCGIEKPISEFYERKDAKCGVRSRCKLCLLRQNEENRKKRRRTIVGYLKLTYSNIKHRCKNPGDKAYKYYGGRGIECRFESVDEFIEYVMNKLNVDPRNLDIDRTNNDGHYEPGNIRFITHKENMNNRG